MLFIKHFHQSFYNKGLMILNNIVRILNNTSVHILDYSSCSNCFEKRGPRDSSFLQNSQGYISEHLYLCKVIVNNIFLKQLVMYVKVFLEAQYDSFIAFNVSRQNSLIPYLGSKIVKYFLIQPSTLLMIRDLEDCKTI